MTWFNDLKNFAEKLGDPIRLIADYLLNYDELPSHGFFLNMALSALTRSGSKQSGKLKQFHTMILRLNNLNAGFYEGCQLCLDKGCKVKYALQKDGWLANLPWNSNHFYICWRCMFNYLGDFSKSVEMLKHIQYPTRFYRAETMEVEIKLDNDYMLEIHHYECCLCGEGDKRYIIVTPDGKNLSQCINGFNKDYYIFCDDCLSCENYTTLRCEKYNIPTTRAYELYKSECDCQVDPELKFFMALLNFIKNSVD